MYEIIIPDPVDKWIHKHLNNELIERLDKKIQKLKSGPDIYGKPLRGQLAGVWEIYFEKRYRVLYEIDYQRKEVYILGIKHKDELTK